MSYDSKALYLGDGVYAQLDEWGCVVLTTGAHDSAPAPYKVENRIVFEPEVLASFREWLKATIGSYDAD